MKFNREKSFGYPTLRTFLEGDDPSLLDYPKTSFDPSIWVTISVNEPDYLILNYEVGLRVPTLQRLIEARKAKVYFKVECSSTFFSDVYGTSVDEGEFKIEANLLKDQIEITSFIIAEKKLTLSPEGLHSDFSGLQFNIQKGAPLAVSRPTEYHISREQFRSVRSIFDFNKHPDIKPGEFRLRTDEAYVVIEVSPTDYEKVRLAESTNSAKLLILNSLYIPVIMQLLYELTQNPSLAETKRWAGIIRAKCLALGLNAEDPNATLLNAQKLLEMPFGKLAKSGFRT